MTEANTNHQRVLEFIVTGQRLAKKPGCDFSNLVAGSIGYLKAKFHFSDEWTGCKKAASFWLNNKEHAVLLDNDNSCDIPPEALTGRMFEVSVTGVRDGSLIPTTKFKVRQGVH